jgi:tetratricopeptide (TPR) repeat protein
LFTLEFLKHLTRLGLLWNDTKRWHWREPPADAMPVTVEALIEQLLFDASDSPDAQRVLRAKAFLETRVPQLTLDHAVLGQVAQVTSLETALVHWVRRGILNHAGFAHPLFREVTVKQLLETERQSLAARSLEALQHMYPEHAAGFLEDSGLPPQTAFQTLMSCANALAAQPARAAQLKARAARYLQDTEKAALVLEALTVLVHSEPKQAQGLAESLLELPNISDSVRADAVYYATSAIVTNTRSIAAAEASLARLPQAFHNDARHVSSFIGYLMMCGQAPRALEIWGAHPELHATVETPVLIHVLSALMLTGQMQAAETMTVAVLGQTNLLPRERMSILNVRAISLAQLGQFEASQSAALEAIVLAEQLEQHNAVGVMRLNRAVTLERSDRKAMQREATLALAALERAGNTGLAAQAQLMLSYADFECGHHELAEEGMNLAYATLKQGAISPFLVTLELALTRFHLERFNQYGHILALKYARDAMRHAQTLGQPKLMANAETHLGVVLLQLRQLNEAQRLIETALPVLRDAPDSTSSFALAARARLLEGLSEPALEAWQTAIDRAETLGFLFDAHCYRLELARLENNPGAAQDDAQWFETQGLLHGVRLAKRYFPALNSLDFDSDEQRPLPSWQLQVLGMMQIFENGISVVIKGQKRKELLVLLLEARMAGHSQVKTLELLDRLYPNAPEDEAQAALKQTVFKARAAHGQGIIVTTANGYTLGQVSSDAETFLQTGTLNLWRGAYLDGLVASDDISQALMQTAQQQVQTMLKDNPKEAARVMRILLEMDPYDPLNLRLLCLALRASGNHRSLQRVYFENQVRLLEVGEVLPERWQDFLQ